MILRLLSLFIVGAILYAEDASAPSPLTHAINYVHANRPGALFDFSSALEKANDQDVKSALDTFFKRHEPQDAQLVALILERINTIVPSSTLAAASTLTVDPIAESNWTDNLVTTLVLLQRVGIESSTTVDRISALLNHPQPRICDVTLTTIEHLQDDRFLPRLIPLLSGAEPVLARKAHRMLCQQANEKLPLDINIWKSWYENRLKSDKTMLKFLVGELHAPETQRVINALHKAATLLTVRNQVIGLLIPLAQGPPSLISTTASDYLREFTKTSAEQPLALSIAKIQAHAATIAPDVLPPPPPPVLLSIPAAKPFYTRSFLDTWQGLFTIITVIFVGLTITIYLLRTPVGIAVQGATMRFARKTGAARVAVAVGENTMRLMKPMMKPIKQLTKRISKNTKRMARKAELGTRRLARPSRKRIAASSDEHAALEQKMGGRIGRAWITASINNAVYSVFYVLICYKFTSQNPSICMITERFP